jgi:hypothetical protein
MMQSVFDTVEKRVFPAEEQCGILFGHVSSFLRANQRSRTKIPEPLQKLFKGEAQVWSSSCAGSYSAKEEGQHIKRLQAYVQAAVDKAVGQLHPYDPDLVEMLKEALTG